MMTFISNKEYTWTCKVCNKIFRVQRDLRLHYKENPKHRYFKKKELRECPYCGLKKETTKEGMTLHKKYCKANPNAEKYCLNGYKHSLKTKQKMSQSRKKAFKEGRIKRTGWLDRQKRNRSYAEQWLKDYIDNYCNDLNYKEDYPIKNYLLDFAWPEKQICIEMDGEQHFINSQQFESDRRKDEILKNLGWKVLRIRWKECLIDKEQFKNIIYDFIEKTEIIPFEKRYKSKKELYKEMRKDFNINKRISDKELENRWNLIRKYLPFKYGWIRDCIKETGLSRRQIEKVCEIYKVNFRTVNSGVAQK